MELLHHYKVVAHWVTEAHLEQALDSIVEADYLVETPVHVKRRCALITKVDVELVEGMSIRRRLSTQEAVIDHDDGVPVSHTDVLQGMDHVIAEQFPSHHS